MNTLDALIRDAVPASIIVQPPKEVWIAIRTDGVPDIDPTNPVVIGDGTQDNPWDGSTAVKFDALHRAMTSYEGLSIHLGPGLFRTGGSTGNASHYIKWQPNNGWKIIGAGQYQTTLLLTVYNDAFPYPSGQNSYDIINSGDRYLDGFELSDLTLDCGVDDQPMPSTAKHSWPQIKGDGFELAGRNIIIRRVRFINFGTREPTNVNGEFLGGAEAFPALFEPSPGAADITTAEISFNQVLEDCIFEQPFQFQRTGGDAVLHERKRYRDRSDQRVCNAPVLFQHGFREPVAGPAPDDGGLEN